MIFRGGLFITDSIDEVYSSLMRRNRVVKLLDSASEDPVNSMPETIQASILLPPYESVMADLDGNKEAAAYAYLKHLETKEVDMFLCAVMTAMHIGFTVVIYAGKDENEMGFIPILLQHILNKYGIMVGSAQSNFGYNEIYDGIIASSMYMYDMIGVMEYMAYYPAGVALPIDIIPKLVMDVNPYLDSYTPENYIKYFNDYKEAMKSNGNKPLINPFIRG